MAISKCGVPTRLSNGFGILSRRSLEEIIIKADSIDPAKMKQAALDLNEKLTVMTGPYKIEPTGKQVSMEFVIMQNRKWT